MSRGPAASRTAGAHPQGASFCLDASRPGAWRAERLRPTCGLNTLGCARAAAGLGAARPRARALARHSVQDAKTVSEARGRGARAATWACAAPRRAAASCRRAAARRTACASSRRGWASGSNSRRAPGKGGGEPTLPYPYLFQPRARRAVPSSHERTGCTSSSLRALSRPGGCRRSKRRPALVARQEALATVARRLCSAGAAGERQPRRAAARRAHAAAAASPVRPFAAPTQSSPEGPDIDAHARMHRTRPAQRWPR